MGEVASSSPTSISPYPYWLNGLLTEKSVYDLNGKLLKKIQYNYEIDNNSGDKLPQMQPSNFYLDEESLEPFFKKQGTPYLTGEEMYRLNIEPRLSPANVDRFYNLQYGWKIVLKEEWSTGVMRIFRIVRRDIVMTIRCLYILPVLFV